MQAGGLGGAPAALAGDDLEAAAVIGGMRAGEQRLEDAAGADRFRELGYGAPVVAARLEGAGLEGNSTGRPGRRTECPGARDGIGGAPIRAARPRPRRGVGLALMPGAP